MIGAIRRKSLFLAFLPLVVAVVLVAEDHSQTPVASNGENVENKARSGKLRQFITLGDIAAQRVGSFVTLPKTASSGLQIEYTSLAPAICRVSEKISIKLIASGICTIQATQRGSRKFAPTEEVTRSFRVRPLDDCNSAYRALQGQIDAQVWVAAGEPQWITIAGDFPENSTSPGCFYDQWAIGNGIIRLGNHVFEGGPFDGSVKFSDFQFISKGKIKAKVDVPLNHRATSGYLFADCDGCNYVSWGSLYILPMAKIIWNENGADITVSGQSSTQKVVVGQPIQLSSQVKLPPGVTITKHIWDIDDDTIGTYVGPQNGLHNEPAVLDADHTSFYWITTGKKTVRYRYCVLPQGGTEVCPNAEVSATFEVQGPSNATMYACLGYPTVNCAQLVNPTSPALPIVRVGIGPGRGVLKLTIGGKSSALLGIAFTGTSEQSASPPGQFLYAQIINGDSWTYNYASGSPCSSEYTPGLDSTFPYQVAGPSAWDQPGYPLANDDLEVTASFDATMHLLWTATNISGAIPVPIGYIQWSWKGDAVQDVASHSWAIREGTNTEVDVGQFVSSPLYPEWDWVVNTEQAGFCAH